MELKLGADLNEIGPSPCNTFALKNSCFHNVILCMCKIFLIFAKYPTNKIQASLQLKYYQYPTHKIQASLQQILPLSHPQNTSKFTVSTTNIPPTKYKQVYSKYYQYPTHKIQASLQ